MSISRAKLLIVIYKKRRAELVNRTKAVIPPRMEHNLNLQSEEYKKDLGIDFRALH